jgi:hypothetical protein
MDALQAYASSSSSDEENVTRYPRKRIRSESENETKEEKQSRWIRSFPHVKGNWPSHVFISVDLFSQKAFLRRYSKVLEVSKAILQEQQVKLIPFRDQDTNSGNEKEDFHLSLSRPFVLRWEQIESFVADLRSALKWRKA